MKKFQLLIVVALCFIVGCDDVTEATLQTQGKYR